MKDDIEKEEEVERRLKDKKFNKEGRNPIFRKNELRNFNFIM